MKRWMCILLALLTALSAPVLAEEMPATEAAGLPAESLAADELPSEVLIPVDPVEALESEQLHEIVRSLFLAAAGTDFEWEAALIEQLQAQEAQADVSAGGTTEESRMGGLPAAETTQDAATVETLSPTQQRRADLSAYRAHTLPWLKLAFLPAEAGPAEGSLLPAGSGGADSAADSEQGSFVPAADGSETSASAGQTAAEASVWTPETAMECFRASGTGREYLALLEPLGGTDAASCLERTQAVCRRWLGEIDHEKLAQINGDYACWLYCADTQIDYPVVQGADNSYYLDRLFNGAYNSGGTLFIDYRNLPGFQDPNTLVYGHHMRNDSMFGILTEYEQPGFYESHPFLLLVSAEEIAVIELFAGYTTSKNDHCYDIAISGEEDKLAFVEEARAKSDFVTDAQILPHDRLVTLSTCAYAFQNARYIAIGRLETVWQKGDAGER